MIVIKNKNALAKMRQAGEKLSPIVEIACREIAQPGVSTAAVDAWIEKELRKAGMTSKAKGYKGYKHVSCISVNDVIVHGVPSENVILKPGDLVTIDVCAAWNEYCADMARCFFVGGVYTDQAKRFSDTAQRALDIGIKQMVPGKRLSDISAAIQQEVEQHGFGVIRDFAGHGIGKRMHEEPEVVNYGKPGEGPVLLPGMVFAIEPMISLGDYKVRIAKDGWTAHTADGSLAAHVEDTVVITEQGPQILTRLS
ncbi:type I methionyl aminopeptidase [candidate division TM6 bacterium RIFCSPHIGHO2_12_FULL_36_22]|nr:MAG: type I methionyl aminopeptidase [candidate division TM6 bacterium RIFCSPHIGHO2_12_FULL_36_22]